MESPDGLTKTLRTRLLLLAGLVVVLLGVVGTDLLHAPLLRGVAAMERVMAAHPTAGALGFVAASAVSAMLAFFSSALLVPSAVAHWGLATAMVLLWIGWMVGGALAYWVARSLGRTVARRLMPARTFDWLASHLSVNTPFQLVLLLQMALPSELPGYLLGLARYPFGRYLLALGLAELPFAIGTVLLGQGLLTRSAGLLLWLGAGALALSAIAVRLLQQRLHAAD